MEEKDRSKIKGLVALNKLEQAINFCLNNKNVPSSIQNKMVVIAGDFSNCQSEKINDTIDHHQERIWLNKIRTKILSAIKDNSIVIPLDEKDLNYIPSLSEEQVIGREEEIEAIDALLERHQIAFIHGMRGIGKTSILKLYLHQHRDKFNYVIWGNVLNTIKEGLMNDIDLMGRLGISFSSIGHLEKKSKQKEDLTQSIITKIKAFRADSQRKKHNLIILDSVKDIEELKGFIKKLPSSQWKILISSSFYSDYFENNQLPIEPLPNQLAKDLFIKHSKRKLKKDDLLFLEFLLSKIGSHTLTIELLGKVYAQSSDINIKELFEQLEDKWLESNRLTLDVEVEHNNYNTINPAKYINSLFDIKNLTVSESIILHIFSILPSMEIEGGILLKALDKIPKRILYYLNSIIIFFNLFSRKKEKTLNRINFIQTLNNLVRKGWIVSINDKYRCHDVIREITLSELKKNHRYSKMLVSTIYDHVFKSIVPKYEFEYKFMTAFLVCNNIINSSKTFDNKIFIKDIHWYYYRAVYSLTGLGLTDLAINFVEKGDEYSTKLNIERKSSWSNVCLFAYSGHGDRQLFKKYQEKSLSFLNKSPLSKKTAQTHAGYYSHLGSNYFRNKNYKEAKANFEKSKEIYELFYNKERYFQLDYSYTLVNLGDTLYKMKKYKKAQVMIENSLDIRRKIYKSETHPNYIGALDLLKEINKKLKNKG